MAVFGFPRTLQQLAGPGQPYHEWAVDTMVHVMTQCTLPSGVSLRQIDDLVTLLPTAIPYMPPGDTSNRVPLRYGVLALAGACALELDRDQKKKEAFVADACAALSVLQEEGSRDNTSLLCADTGVVSMAMHCGDIMCDLGRQRDAVEMGRRLRPLVESATAAAQAQYPACNAMHACVDWLRHYASWLLRCAPKHPTILEATACVEYGERHGVLMRAIDLTTSHPRIEEKLESLYADVATAESACGRYMSALEWSQRAMKLPQPGLMYTTAAYLAVDALLHLRRDTQAESMLKETLAKAARLRILNPLMHAILLQYQAVILGRRGKHEASLPILDRAEAQARAVLPSDHGAAVRTVATVTKEIQALRLDAYEALGRMDKVKELEEFMGDEKWRRSDYVVRQAKAWVAAGQRDEAIRALWVYLEDFVSGGYEWRTRARRNDGGLRPLELLRDLSDEDGEKQTLEDVIRTTRDEEERLRAEALEEVRAEGRDGPRKPRKKKKRGKKKKSSARTLEAAMAGLQVGESAEGGGGGDLGDAQLKQESDDGKVGQQKPQEEEEQQLCSICLAEVDADDDDVDVGDQADVLVCSHVYHTSCLDRWACKCARRA